MKLALHYAKALHQLVSKNPTEGRRYLASLRKTLAQRGHTRLLPCVYAEYEKLLLREERTKRFLKETLERARTRALAELYRTLIRS